MRTPVTGTAPIQITAAERTACYWLVREMKRWAFPFKERIVSLVARGRKSAASNMHVIRDASFQQQGKCLGMPQSKSRSILNHVPMAGSMAPELRPDARGDSMSGFGKRAACAICHRRVIFAPGAPNYSRRGLATAVNAPRAPWGDRRAILEDASPSQFIAILVDPGGLLNRQ